MNTQSSSQDPKSDSPNSLGISGRVANLAGGNTGEITATGSSERDVLMKVTREFKSRVLKLHEENQEIPLIDPPQPRLPNEQMRSVPVHL